MIAAKNAKKNVAYFFEEDEEEDTLFIADGIETKGDSKGLLRAWLYIPSVEVLEITHIFPDATIKLLTLEYDLQRITKAVFEFKWVG